MLRTDRVVRISGYCHAGQMADGNNVCPQNAKLRRKSDDVCALDSRIIYHFVISQRTFSRIVSLMVGDVYKARVAALARVYLSRGR